MNRSSDQPGKDFGDIPHQPAKRPMAPGSNKGLFIELGAGAVVLATAAVLLIIFVLTPSGKVDEIAVAVGMDCKQAENPEDFFNNFSDDTKGNEQAREVHLRALQQAELFTCDWQGGQYAVTDPDVVSDTLRTLFSDPKRYSDISEEEYARFEELCTHEALAEQAAMAESRFSEANKASSIIVDNMIIFRAVSDEGDVKDLRDALEADGFETGFLATSYCGAFN